MESCILGQQQVKKVLLRDGETTWIPNTVETRNLLNFSNKRVMNILKNIFTFTLLEYFGLSYDPMKIKDREQYWKRCFDTIKNGYNDN